MTQAPTRESMLAAVQNLTPMIEAHAAEAETLRRPVDAVIDALRDTGVFMSYVPSRYGGLEIDTDTFIDVGLAVSQACTSTGWVTTFYMEHNWMLAQFPTLTQDAIFGAQGYILAPASISPSGKANAVDGGYRLSGRWPWGTGVMHADWILLNAMVEGTVPDPRMFLVPRSEIEVEDTWYAAGMEGTGSNDMIAEDLFVPAARSESLIAMAFGRGSGATGPCYRHPMLPLLTLAAGTPALGAARRALELFKARLGERTLYGTPNKQAERPSAQILLGNCSARLRSAETVLRAVGHEFSAWGDREAPCPTEDRARMRVQVAQVVQTCRDVVQALMQRSGAGAHMRTQPMQRLLRDINTLSCHTVFDEDLGGENYGRILLGMDPASLA
ncbi:MAG: acyl-CoA dehydrogenase family protein [Pseudomonadota bacterium]